MHQTKTPIITMKKVLPSMAGLGAVALLVGGLAGPLLANDKDSDTTAASAPDMQEMMKKMEAQAAPGAEHQWLAALAGEWETEARCYMAGPETEPTVTKGTCQSKMILGGRFLQEE